MNVRLLTASLIVQVALFMSGCEVLFTNPPAGNPEKDKALLGRWISEEKDKESSTQVRFDQGSHDQMNISFIPGDPNERNPVFTAKLTKLGTQSYLILNPADEDRDKGFLIAKYEIRQDELTVWIQNSEKVKALINQKIIKGEVRAPGAVVTESSENVTKFLQSSVAEKTFELFGKFKKAKG